MKSLKVAKYEFFDALNSIKVYYAIIIVIFASMTLLAGTNGGEIRSSGVEFSTAIFIFIAGLNSFKNSFKFTQGNNITRKTFFKGVMISTLPIAALMAVADVILNRMYNLFVVCPTMYDMLYDKGFGQSVWSQSNSLGTLFGTVLFLVFLYTMTFNLGIFINLIYYRSNTVLKVIISVAPFVLITLIGNFHDLFPKEFWNGVGNFLVNAFGLNDYNPYAAVFSFFIIAVILSGFIFLLIRRAVVKD
ncbi:hypothetical protein J2Z44_002887 [Clostridium punense]|uniref:ABC transporter permease n=1 Tax=Clostridium punense TaxID=1054297 RepID=A0ABS4K5L1_9CLOT|nr:MULTISPECIES: hypothetical protein [Clostridium]EQB89193.1 hypothetical protein M918_21440 [Clostridium sp. BL8]MBP2023062.1 hypothetical protein [Clostridium punense]